MVLVVIIQMIRANPGKRHHDKSQFKDSSVKSLREKSVFCLNFSFVGQQRSASELSAFLNVTHCEREVH